MPDFTMTIQHTYAPNTIISSSQMNTNFQISVRDKFNSALDGSTGHTHDGTTGNGAPIVLQNASPTVERQLGYSGGVLQYHDGSSAISVLTQATTPLVQGVENIRIVNATTTNSNDSIRITGATASLSSSNPGYVTIPNVSGVLTRYSVTADVTIDLTGAHWGAGGNDDLTDAILRVFAINDNDASLIWGVSLLGGRNRAIDTVSFTTQTSVTDAEDFLVNSSLTSGTWAAIEIGWFRCNFDDTGGAAEDLWAVQSGVGDLNLGSADGHWQPYNPNDLGGFSAFAPEANDNRWTSIGSTVHVIYDWTGTSNSNSFSVTLPVKHVDSSDFEVHALTSVVDNGSSQADPGFLSVSSSVDYGVQVDRDYTLTAWTTSGNKKADGYFTYEAYHP